MHADNENVQNSSPALSSPSSLPFSPASRQRQSHSGYSSSARAIGSSLPFRKFRPLRTEPAGDDETGSDVLGFGRWLAPGEVALGAGERGVEKGCATLVDLAAGGSDGEELSGEVVRERVIEGCMRNAEARCR